MGNTENWVSADTLFPTEQQLLNQLIPIDDGENNNEMLSIGRFKIFRFRTEPYEIIMKHVRTFSPIGNSLGQFDEAARTIATRLDHKNIAKIHSVNICRRSNICSENVSIESYVNYYGLDLQAIIEQRKRTDRRFRAQQIWYILNSLVEASTYLKGMEIYFGIYLAKNIFISPEGYVKLYLYHCTATNQHMLYNHIVGHQSRETFKYLPLPPECLPFLNRKAQTLPGVDLQKMDIFGIGMVALEAMLFNPTRRYYLDQSDSDLSLSFDHKQFKADFAELKEVYPPKLIKLVELMTKSSPQDRIGLNSARHYIKSVREDISIGGSIRIHEDEESSIPKLSYKFTPKDCQEVLRSITSNENKLEYFPLKAVSKEKFTSCQSSYRPLHQSQAGKHKLQLSSLTTGQGSSRFRDSRLLSSFR